MVPINSVPAGALLDHEEPDMVIRQFHYSQLEPLDSRVLELLPQAQAAKREDAVDRGFALKREGAVSKLFHANNHGLWRYIDRSDHFEGTQ